jgi:DNA polymerase-3 subunit delta'
MTSATAEAPREEQAAPWRDVLGQHDAVQVLQHAASDPAAMTHAWLITEPPGSGRSNLAYAFAAALIADPGDTAAMAQVIARSHPDVTALRTEQVVIRIDQARQLVERASFAPSVGRHRVIVVEDADRMSERTSNVLLKALEEPPERTVWVLCAPSDVDLLPTIRSRTRVVRLREPRLEDVAALVADRTGVDLEVAEQAARHAQRHIGMARRLAVDESARERRDRTLREALQVRGVSDAVEVASRIVQAATDDAAALTAERDRDDREALLRTVGLADGAAIPPAVRAQLTALAEEQKRRATRSLRDGIDRVLTDLQSLFRDLLMVQFGRDQDLVNRELAGPLHERTAQWSRSHTLAVLDDLSRTRRNLERNVAPALALESLLITIATGRTA